MEVAEIIDAFVKNARAQKKPGSGFVCLAQRGEAAPRGESVSLGVAVSLSPKPQNGVCELAPLLGRELQRIA
jgi:hypothetical protein